MFYIRDPFVVPYTCIDVSRKPGTEECNTVKHNSYSQKISEVENIVRQLKQEHGSTFSTEQLNAWAHMIHLQKHDSLIEPPQLPYFVKRSKRSSDIAKQHRSTYKSRLRLQCIDQLDKWHSLLEKGGITQTQYDKLQKEILGDNFDKDN